MTSNIEALDPVRDGVRSSADATPARPAPPLDDAALPDGLRRDDAAGRQAQAELHRFIRRGLGRTFGRDGGVDDGTLDDLAQDAMIRVVERLDGFRGDSRFTTWAMAVAIRTAATALRRRRWGDRSLEGLGIDASAAAGPADRAADPRDAVGRRDVLEALRDAIERDLTPRQRAAVLGEMAGMPVPVLAEQLDTNPNALYKLHHDARLRLRAALERRGFGPGDVRAAVPGASNR